MFAIRISASVASGESPTTSSTSPPPLISPIRIGVARPLPTDQISEILVSGAVVVKTPWPMPSSGKDGGAVEIGSIAAPVSTWTVSVMQALGDPVGEGLATWTKAGADG